jgi:hypothetical protein
MLIRIGKDDDVACREFDLWPLKQLHAGPTIDNEMVEHQVFRSWDEFAHYRARWRRRKAPRSRKLGAEEQRAIQLNFAQDFGEGVHGSSGRCANFDGL